MLKPVQPSVKVILILMVIMMVTFVVFSQTLRYEFVNYDDDIYVYENSYIQTPSAGNLWWLCSNIYYTQYIPVTMLSHAVDFAMWKFDARGHHLTNVILHTVNSGCVFLLGLMAIGIGRQGRLGTLPLFGSAAAALLFAHFFERWL